MLVRVEFYKPEEEIPVGDVLKKRKLIKFFDREIAAAVHCAARLLAEVRFPLDMPFYYAKGHKLLDDFDLKNLVDASRDDSGRFSNAAFTGPGILSVSPLVQFRILYNMPLSFIAIEQGLCGDNAVIYASARGLLTQALQAPTDGPILLGAGKTGREGQVHVGFAWLHKHELRHLPWPDENMEAVEIFDAWQGVGVP